MRKTFCKRDRSTTPLYLLAIVAYSFIVVIIFHALFPQQVPQDEYDKPPVQELISQQQEFISQQSSSWWRGQGNITNATQDEYDKPPVDELISEQQEFISQQQEFISQQQELISQQKELISQQSSSWLRGQGNITNATQDEYDKPPDHDLNPEIRTIHWNDTTAHASPPTIYVCHPNDGNALGEIVDVMTNVLPEYQVDYNLRQKWKRFDSRKYLQAGYTNEYDVFLFSLNPLTCTVNAMGWMMTHFNGRIVLYSGESIGQHPIQAYDRSKIHVFGPVDYERENDAILTYLQMSWWKLFQNRLPPEAMVESEKRPRGTRENFMIYAAGNCVRYREKAIGRLSEIGVVHADGRCQGIDGNRTNIVKTNSEISIGNWWSNVDLYSKYRFCFVMEHTNQRGYITEKIMMAFIGGCIPIYYGSELIFDIINEKAFVYYNINDPQPALDLIKNLEMNETLYEEVMNEPIAAHGNETIQKYFSFNDTVGNGYLKKRYRKKLGLDHFEP